MYTQKEKETKDLNYCSSQESFSTGIKKNITNWLEQKWGCTCFSNWKTCAELDSRSELWHLNSVFPHLSVSLSYMLASFSDKPSTMVARGLLVVSGVNPIFSSMPKKKKGLPRAKKSQVSLNLLIGQ